MPAVRKPLAMLAVASLALFMFATPATAETLVDQQQGSSWQGSGFGLPVGQTFTPTVNNITGFDFSLWPLTGTYTVEIWDWSTRDPLISLTATLGPGNVHVDLPAPVSLVPGNRYAIMLTVGPPGTVYVNTDVNIPQSGGDPYVGGALVHNGSEDTFYDAVFATYYDTASLPVPVTASAPAVVPETCEGQTSGVSTVAIEGVRYTGIGDVNGVHTQKFVGPGWTPFDPGQQVYVYAEALTGYELEGADRYGYVRWYLDLPGAPDCGWFQVEASVHGRWIHGQEWEGDLVPGEEANVVVTSGAHELLNTTATIQAKDPGPGGEFSVDPGFDLQPGMTITATASGITKALTLVPLSIGSIDGETGVVTGTASPGIEPDSILHVDTDLSPDPRGYISAWPGTDGSGNWTVNFGEPLVPDNDTGADICDDDGDCTVFDMMVPSPPPPPFFNLEVNDDAIYGGAPYGPWLGPVTITVERGSETFTLGPVPLDPEMAEGGFLHEFSDPNEGLDAFDFQTGDLVIVTDGTNTKVLELTPLEVTVLDVDTDVLGGTCTLEVNAKVLVSSNLGGEGEIDCMPGGTFDATGLIDVRSDDYGGVGQTDSDGDTVSFSWYPPEEPELQFEGFSSPVNNDGVDNVAKAGQTIPLKWRLLDGDGDPISDPSFFGVVLAGAAGVCATGPDDPIEEYGIPNSGLQYLGDGYWQFNWKTPKAYAGKCRVVGLAFAEGQYFGDAVFQFR